MSEEKFPGKIEITLPTAQEWVKKYKEPKLEAKSKKIDAYLIPLESLQKVMDQKIDAVRAYKGINELGEETLMFVGTVLNASTGIYEDVFPQAFNNEVASETEIVYDGGRPCPPYGDPNSPMNT
jgi:hypothetical protein|nr:hypothetical protein [uncultured Flavobacterium sp.]